MLYAVFIRISLDGALQPWRFEGYVSTLQEVEEMKNKLSDENNPYRLKYLPLEGD